ncbi:MAG: PAS domain-containing protein [Leptospira sp.]|nr:PAS domain-containing protein [Leptospira sp.]
MNPLSLSEIDLQRRVIELESELRSMQEVLAIAKENQTISGWEYHIPSGEVFFFGETGVWLETRKKEANESFDWILLEDRNFYRTQIEDILESKSVRQCELRIISDQNRIILLDTFSKAETDEKGNVVKIITYIKFKTDSQPTNPVVGESIDVVELIKEKNLLHSILESTSVSIIVINTDGKIIYVNPTTESMFGLKRSDVQSESYNGNLWKLYTIDGEPCPSEAYPFSLVMNSNDSVNDLRYKVVVSNGIQKYISINSSPIKNEYGKIEKVLAFVSDITEDHLKDIALQENEFKYRTIAETTLSLVYDLDLATLAMSWAGAIFEITGYSFDEYQKFLINDWTNFIHPDDKERVLALMDNAIRTRQRFFAEYKYRIKNGSYIQVEDNAIIFYDEFNNPKRMLGAMIDRTERYKSIEELRKNEESLRIALSAASMGIWIWDIKNQKVTWSERVYEIYKLTETEFRGNIEVMYERTHPDDREKIRKKVESLISVGSWQTDYSFENRLLFPDGSISWIEGTGKLYRNKNGEPYQLIGSTFDITERKRSEEALKQSEKRFQTFYQFSNEAIFIFNEKKKNVVDVNQAFLDLFLYTREELFALSYRKILNLSILRALRKAAEDPNSNKSLEILLYKKGNHPFPARVSIRRFIKEDEQLTAINILDTSTFNEVLELRAINNEIIKRNKVIEIQKTELQHALDNLKQTQSQLVHSEKMAILGQLVAGVAHEINNPIGAIKASNLNLQDWTKNYRNLFEKVLSEYDQLSENEKHCFEMIHQTAILSTDFFTGMQERKLKKMMIAELSARGINEQKASLIVDRLISMGIGEIDIEYLEFYNNEKVMLYLDFIQMESIFYQNTRTIGTAVDRVAKIMYALKNFTHFDKKGIKEMASIIDSLEVVFTIYQDQFKKGIELIKDFDEIPEIECFPDDLLHIWTNLIYNSFQAMDFKGVLTVRVRNLEHTIEVEIQDNGPGIPEEILPQIFDPFFTTKKVGEGSGLGLDIVRKIVQKHNGQIEVRSEALHTSFIVSLPKQS